MNTIPSTLTAEHHLSLLIKEGIDSGQSNLSVLDIMQRIEDKKMTIEKGSSNIYSDLNFKNTDKMLIKARLVQKINEIITSKGLSKIEVALLFKTSQAKISNMLNGDFRRIHEATLIEFLTKLGRDIKIIIGKEKKVPLAKQHLKKKPIGHVEVLFS